MKYTFLIDKGLEMSVHASTEKEAEDRIRQTWPRAGSVTLIGTNKPEQKLLKPNAREKNTLRRAPHKGI